ncbi:MAG: PD40 domain-containing protein [Balneolaceae bacterium]|nr:PD40 domain-containing protein [Balneolaceae bacterium]
MKRSKINLRLYFIDIERIYLSCILTAAVLFLFTACSDNPSSDTANTTGSIEVQMVTTGGDDDPDGYNISIQGGVSVTTEPNGNTVINNVPVGNQTIQLSGIASHCESSGPTSQSVTVTEEETATVAFEIYCKAILRDKILFLKRQESNIYKIYSIDPDGENMKKVSDNNVLSNTNVSISPDGLHIIFSMQGLAGNPNQIWKMNADGTGLQNLTQHSVASFFYPEWSPDGSKISFASNLDNAWLDAFVMNSDGTNMVNITNNPDVQYTFSAWSPDSQQLIFANAEVRSDGPNLFTLEVVNADGSGLQSFINEGPGVVLTKPQWSVNGSISFERFIQGGSIPRQIFITDINRSFERNLIAEAGFPNSPSFHGAWSPDGSKLAFHTISTGNTQNLFISASDGSDFQALTNAIDGTPHISPKWSPFTRN